MSKRITFLCFIVCFFQLSAIELGGKKLPDHINAHGKKLIVNGTYLRRKFFIKIYAVGLYLEKKSQQSTKILSAGTPVTVHQHFIYDGITKSKMNDQWDIGFKTVLGKNVKKLSSEIKRFKSFFTKDIKENDIIVYSYSPGKGTTVTINGTAKGTIKGHAFKKALFSMWISDKQPDEDMVEELLGK